MKPNEFLLTRREMLTRCGMGMGALALTSELQGAKRPPLPSKPVDYFPLDAVLDAGVDWRTRVAKHRAAA